MKKFFRIFIFLISFGIYSCMSTTFEERISPIIETDLPSTGVVGENINFKIKYLITNSCGRYSRSEMDVNDKTITIRFYANYPNMFCRTDLPLSEIDYSFLPMEKGEYYFRFYQDFYTEKEYLLDTLVIR